MIYDFVTGDFHICDIDFYRKAPTKNDMGRMWGSARFMSPEEYELGAELDERTIVYLMGATAFELLGGRTEEAYNAWRKGELCRSFDSWSATKALFDVAEKAASKERIERYQTVTELVEAWNLAKTKDDI
jgi:serine/threonine-protein kinase